MTWAMVLALCGSVLASGLLVVWAVGHLRQGLAWHLYEIKEHAVRHNTDLLAVHQRCAQYLYDLAHFGIVIQENDPPADDAGED